MTAEAMHTAERNDAELVAESLGGSRDAFRQIVERYQTLICSLAYSATGNVSQSEDMAQETFLAAWKQLRALREPDKLRAWLCGIVRNRTQKSLQRERREPVHQAAPLEDAHESPAQEALPSEQTISREEEAILWRSLEKIPELYREPLILFYREHQSIEQVAESLELSEDAVKQRLSRGRKLLQEEVQAFVESALRRTAPGQGFSGAVLAVLPLAAGPAATAGVGAGAKGTAAAKSGFLAAWLAPFVGPLSALAAQWLAIRASTTDRELRAKRTRQLVVTWILAIASAVGGEFALEWLGRHFEWSARTGFAAMAGYWWFWVAASVTWSIVVTRRGLLILQQSEEAGAPPRPAMTPGTLVAFVAGLYLAIFSLLIHLAWQTHDRMSAGIITGTMLVLALWHFFHVRSKTGVAAERAALGHLALAGGIIVVIFHLRFPVWVASAHGVSVAEIHHLRPMWMVPLLTLALLIWVTVLLLLTSPRRRRICELQDTSNGRRSRVRQR